MKLNKAAICVIRNSYFPGCVRLQKEIRALRQSGYSVDIICLRRSGQKHKESIDGVRIFRLAYRHKVGSILRYLFEYGLSFVLTLPVVTLLFFRMNYTCIQVNTMPDALVFTTIIPRLFGAKILLDMHEPTPELWITKFGANRLRGLLRIQILIEKWSIKYANKVITVNETIRKRFIERGADARKIDVVRNVPDESIFALRELPRSDKRFTLMTHGTITERYGHEVILRALPMLQNKIKNLWVYIIGDGDYEEELLNLSKQLGCFDLISFTGVKPMTEIPGYILQSDIGLVTFLPSPFAELCQPNKLFDYIALKRPVVSSRLKAIEETFDDTCIMFFEPGNPMDLARCILELHENPVKRRRLAENAYQRYEKLRWSRTKEIYLKVVEALGNEATS